MKKPHDYFPSTPPVFHILLALADEERHGYGIMQDVARQTDDALQLGPGTLYGCLKRMLAAGLVEESDERPDPALDDERRRYYRMTGLGKRVVRAEAQRLAGAVDCPPKPGWPGGWQTPQSSSSASSAVPICVPLCNRAISAVNTSAMRQVFRDRCRDLARAPGRFTKLHFALALAADWLFTSVRERADIWSAGRKKTPRGFVTSRPSRSPSISSPPRPWYKRMSFPRPRWNPQCWWAITC